MRQMQHLLPDATVSGISFGPWQTPARKTPAVVVPHGFSFGCASRSQPSCEQETPKSLPVFVGHIGRLNGCCEHDHVDLDIHRSAEERVLSEDMQVLGDGILLDVRDTASMNLAPSFWIR